MRAVLATFLSAAYAATVSTPFGAVPSECIKGPQPVGTKPEFPSHCGAAVRGAMNDMHAAHNARAAGESIPFKSDYFTYAYAVTNASHPTGYGLTNNRFHLPTKMSSNKTFRVISGAQSEPWVAGVNAAPTGDYQFVLSETTWRGIWWEVTLWVATESGLQSAKDFKPDYATELLDSEIVVNGTGTFIVVDKYNQPGPSQNLRLDFTPHLPLKYYTVEFGGMGGGCTAEPGESILFEAIYQKYTNGVLAVPLWDFVVTPKHQCNERFTLAGQGNLVATFQ